jgi:TolB protein
VKRLFALLLCCLPLLSSNAQGIDVPGQIAYIGTDYNVYSANLQADQPQALTTDASRTRSYQWPTWSQDGALAYFCCDPARTTQPYTEIFISPDGLEAGKVRYIAEAALFTYAAWSPRNCAEGETCRDLAVLLTLLGESAFGVDVIRAVDDEDATGEIIGRGQPFYFSWSPDGSRLLTQRDTERIDVYDFGQSKFSEFTELDAGLFPAPEWSPVDDRLLVGLRNSNGRSTDLAILAGDEINVLERGLRGEVSFNWSPNGNAVAYRTLFSEGASTLTVVDAVTGETIAETRSEDVFAFFWSPDSRKIAFISVASPRGTFNASYSPTPTLADFVQEDGLRWSVLDVASGQQRNYSSFLPTSEMLYLLSFFNQFAQSHSIWSPDSTHIVFSELREDDSPVISILDMSREDAVPFAIAEGLIGIWSYR